MARSTEREIKLAVDDAAALERVMMAAGGDARPPVTQRNRFFDTPGFALRAAGYGLRLRTEAEPRLGGAPAVRHLLAVKGPRQDDAIPGLTVRREVEREVDAEAHRALVEGGLEPIAILAGLVEEGEDRALVESLRARLDGPLAYVGSFENERTRVDTVMIVDGEAFELVLELDTTCFPGGVLEHEVELEIPGEMDGKSAVRALRSLLAIAGVAGRPARGKATRFFERLPARDAL